MTMPPALTRSVAGVSALVLIAGGALVGLPAIARAVLGHVAPEEPEAVRPTDVEGATFWGHNADGTPYRWDPCSTIELVIDPRYGPTGWLDPFMRAVDEIADASGLDLAVIGTTTERPRADRGAFDPDTRRWAPVLVAWAAPGEGGLPLRATDKGLAMPLAVGEGGRRVFVSGQIVFNADLRSPSIGEDDPMTMSWDDRAGSWPAVMLHELGHLLGLGHVDDPDQLMHPHPGHGPTEFGDGDLRGLRALAAGGCLQRPAPRQLPHVGFDVVH